MKNSNDVKNFIVDNFLFGDQGSLKEDSDLFKESILDSTGILELIAFMEMNYNIAIQDNEIIQDNFSSINAIEKFLEKKTQPETSKVCAD